MDVKFNYCSQSTDYDFKAFNYGELSSSSELSEQVVYARYQSDTTLPLITRFKSMKFTIIIALSNSQFTMSFTL